MNLFLKGIEILRDLLMKVANMPDKVQAQTFYQKHFMTVLEHVLGVVTDNNQVQFVGESFLIEHFFINLIFRFDQSGRDRLPSLPSGRNSH